MLFVEAHDMTAEELSELRARHDIVDQPGYVTTLRARKTENRIVWSIKTVKEHTWRALQQEKKAETSVPTLV